MVRQNLKDGKIKPEKHFECLGCRQPVFNFLLPCLHINTFCVDCHHNRIIDHRNPKYYTERDTYDKTEIELVRKLNAVENVITYERSLKCNICQEKIEDFMLFDADKEWKPEKFLDPEMEELTNEFEKIALEEALVFANSRKTK